MYKILVYQAKERLIFLNKVLVLLTVLTLFILSLALILNNVVEEDFFISLPKHSSEILKYLLIFVTIVGLVFFTKSICKKENYLFADLKNYKVTLYFSNLLINIISVFFVYSYLVLATILINRVFSTSKIMLQMLEQKLSFTLDRETLLLVLLLLLVSTLYIILKHDYDKKTLILRYTFTGVLIFIFVSTIIFYSLELTYYYTNNLTNTKTLYELYDNLLFSNPILYILIVISLLFNFLSYTKGDL